VEKAAFDLDTGEDVWRTPQDKISSWGTPNVYECAVQPEPITHGTNFIRSYDPRTDDELRRSRNSEITVSTRVIRRRPPLLRFGSQNGQGRPVYCSASAFAAASDDVT